MPPDPFAGDPDDPAVELEALDDEHGEPVEPLSPDERESVLDDLEDVDVFAALLEPRGVRGLVVDCADCHEEHFFAWDLAAGQLRHLLDSGNPAGARAGVRPRPGALRHVGVRPRLRRRHARRRGDRVQADRQVT